MAKLSERRKRFDEVAKKVGQFIEDYTIPRYGDEGEDRSTNMGAFECIEDIKKYTARIRAPERYAGERAEDMLKIMQLAAESYLKILDIQKNTMV